MRVIVTGGAGYIGSIATRRLLDRGDDVVVVDNFVNGHAASVSRGAERESVDIRDSAALLRIMRAHQTEAVLHFAALTIAPESVRDPGPYWSVNTGGTLSLLEAMRSAEVPLLVMSSTAAVYGVPDESPIPETTPLRPINPYGASKLAAEQAVNSYASAYGLHYTALRYFNVAGAAGDIGEDHRPETHLIPSALDAAAGRRPSLSIFGDDYPTRDGTAIRDYVHVEDLIDAHLAALERMRTAGESLGAINLGSRDGASVCEVLEAVERVTGLAVPAEVSPRRPGDPPSLIADAARARDVLGWTPARSTLDQMIGSAWNWRQRFPEGYPSG
ncbi:MAG: UDP-glucose 4-epimerase GalE [Thermomicrobiales bacterium]